MGVYKPQGRRFYVIDFRYHGARILKRTKFTREEDAQLLAATMLTEMERKGYGLPLRPQPLTLRDFIDQHFRRYVENNHQKKPNTLLAYQYGIKALLQSPLADRFLHTLTDADTAAYSSKHEEEGESPSTINRDMRTLRKALYKAQEWNMLEKVFIIKMLEEVERDRVLTPEEADAYTAACPQPWRDCAIYLLGTACRPMEAYTQRWENVVMGEDSGIIRVLKGKGRKSKRNLPMLPEVLEMLKARYAAQGRPALGFIFPALTGTGHIEQGSVKQWHRQGLRDCGVRAFPPYVLRHTAMTRLGAVEPNIHTLAKIAGHSSPNMLTKYIHPVDEAVIAAFQKLVKNPPTKVPPK